MEKDKETQQTAVQTYAEDMARVIKDSQGGLIKKIIHGEEEHEAFKRNISPQSKKNRFFMITGFLFIFLSLITLSFFYFNQEIETILVEQQFTPLIFNDASSFIEIKDLNKDQISSTILNEINTTQVKLGGVAGIYLTENKKVVGLRRFLKLIESNFVAGSSVFVSDNFLMGVMNSKIQPALSDTPMDQGFFVLLKVRSITDVFDSLRGWESKMFSDLHGFFGVSISPATKYLLTKEFQDDIVGNRNARILYDNNNQVVMMYVFADDNSIVVTNSRNAVHEVMLRLASGRVKQ